MSTFHSAERRRVQPKRRLWVGALVLTGLAGISAVSLRSRAAGSPSAPVKPAPPATATSAAPSPARPPVKPATQGGSTGDIGVELLTAHTWGFDPRQITRPEGPFYILMQNRAGLASLDIRLNRLSGVGGVLKQVEMPEGKTRKYDLYDLPPGEYILSESANPTWTCTITITPK